MPAIVGPVQIINVDGGTVQFGDTLLMNPKAASKSVAGSGAGNTGAFILTNNLISVDNILDVNAIDQPILGNN
ncbi:MAG: spore germination protein [Bacillales bacterium]|jgi:spore germination protein PF|nr:spore germination protein [Bacillales bacterium]